MAKMHLALPIGLILLSACSLRPFGESGANLKLKIDGQTEPKNLMSSLFDPNQVQSFTAPTAISGFNCLMVNVIGDGIASSGGQTFTGSLGSLLTRDSYCSYAGVIAGPVDVNTGGTVSLNVPSGSSRLIQLVGSDASSACTVSGARDTTTANLYEVGRAVVDIFEAKEVSITGEYNSLTATNQAARKVNCGGSSSSQTYSDLILATAGLTHYWHLGESSGAFADSVGINHLSFINNPTSIAGDIPGGDNAASFDGISNRVSYASGLDLGSGNFSLEFWFILPSSQSCTTSKYMLNAGSGSNYITAYCTYNSPYNSLVFGVRATFPDSVMTNATFSVNDDLWHHAVLVYDSSIPTLQIYYDGVANANVSPGSTGPFTFTGGAFVLGSDGASSYGQVKLDEMATYNVALSAATVLEHYNKGNGGH